ncbi:MAG: (2Fe-2S)-binding protein [Myxococcales bacterium]|nr:(2Fe-2S)-binding protein [Myxococcales bacterium]
MIVCHCKGISDRTIRDAVRAGARSCGQVARSCDAGRCCGGCAPVIRELIARESETENGLVLLGGAGLAATA